MRSTLAAGLLALFAAATPARAAGLDYPIDAKVPTTERALALRALKVLERECSGWFKDVNWRDAAAGVEVTVLRPFKNVKPSKTVSVWGAAGWSAAVIVQAVAAGGAADFMVMVGGGKRPGIASWTEMGMLGVDTCQLSERHGEYTFREVPELGFLRDLK